jgi:hypothetical protein
VLLHVTFIMRVATSARPMGAGDGLEVHRTRQERKFATTSANTLDLMKNYDAQYDASEITIDTLRSSAAQRVKVRLVGSVKLCARRRAPPPTVLHSTAARAHMFFPPPPRTASR